MTSIFEGQPPENKAFSNQNKGHLGSRVYIYIYARMTYDFPSLRFAESPRLPDQMYHTCPKTGWDSNTSRYPQLSKGIFQESHVTKTRGLKDTKLSNLHHQHLFVFFLFLTCFFGMGIFFIVIVCKKVTESNTIKMTRCPSLETTGVPRNSWESTEMGGVELPLGS